MASRPVYVYRLLSTAPAPSAIDLAKTAAGSAAVKGSLLPTHKVIGIGSGSTIVAVVEELVKDMDAQKDRWFVPTGWQSRKLIVDSGLKLAGIDQFPKLDIAFDGADDIDADLEAIKGGGGCHFREKIVAQKSDSLVLVADWRKQSDTLGTGHWTRGVPIEVVPFAAKFVEDDLRKASWTKSVTLRQGGSSKAGPVITDNGNFILDAVFSDGVMAKPAKLSDFLKLLTGVVDVGLFVGLAQEAYFGLEDGTVQHIKRPAP
ncbi:ribose-5-phosphate isomerase [Meredithblackwellia eburnea MCA 4105]